MAVLFKKVSGAVVCNQAVAAEKMMQVLANPVTETKKILLGKGKVTVVQDSVLIDSPAESVPSIESALKAIGMTPVAEVPRGENSSMGAVSPGDRVEVVSAMYDWVSAYKVGDQGVVVKAFSPVKEAVQYGDRYGILEVLLDSGASTLLYVGEVKSVAKAV